MSRFTEALIVSPLSDGKTWVVFRRFGYEVGEEGSDDIIDVKIGFMTDFASIPRVFWFILPKWGKYGNAAVIHDWIYWSQERSRAEADRIMFEAMGVLSVAAWQKYPIFWAVRLFGWAAWKRNYWDKAAGFDRVLSRRRLKAIEISRRLGLVHRFLKHYLRIKK